MRNLSSMERLKFMGRALAIGTRTISDKPLSAVVNIVALLAVLGVTVAVQYGGLPDMVKVGIPFVLLLLVFGEGSFRLWRDAGLDRAISQLPTEPSLREAPASPEPQPKPKPETRAEPESEPQPDISAMTEYERMVYEDLEDEKHRNELEAQLQERDRERAASGIGGLRLVDATNSYINLGKLKVTSATPMALGNVVDSTVEGEDWDLGGAPEQKQ